MGTTRTSSGYRVSTQACNERIRDAKAAKLRQFLDEHGYFFCEDCKRNDCKPIDCSHNISVANAKKSGRTELCWDVDNITLRGRKCHQKYDKLL